MSKRKWYRLTVDLTKYLPGLVVNSVGYDVGYKGMWSRTFPGTFTTINFPNIGELDVKMDSLEEVVGKE